MEVVWQKCEGEKWCSFLTTNLQHERFESAAGVYVIWHSGRNPRTVRVGQGLIRERIDFHRHNHKIVDCGIYGRLLMTWAEIPQSQRDGVERYLVDKLKPLIEAEHPDAKRIRVNLPW